MLVVLYDLFGLPVTSGGVGVLEGRSFAPSDALRRPHYPLESLTVMGGRCKRYSQMFTCIVAISETVSI